MNTFCDLDKNFSFQYPCITFEIAQNLKSDTKYNGNEKCNYFPIGKCD